MDTPTIPAWIEAMLPAGHRRSVVEVGPGIGMHVTEVGEGRPVVMVHGNPTWGLLYRKVASALAGEPLRLVMPDLIGLGYSTRPAVPVDDLAQHARWLSACLARLELEDVVLVVQDWGGAIGVLGAGRRIGALVALNTVLGPPREGFRPTAFHRLAHSRVWGRLLLGHMGLTQRTMQWAQGDRRSLPRDVRRAYIEPLRGSHAPLELARMVPDTMAHPSVSTLRQCAAIVEAFDGPAAIVWGRNDPILGRLLRRTQRMLPQAHVTETDAGHFLQEEVPDAIADAVRRVT